jgi:hypothetical protein
MVALERKNAGKCTNKESIDGSGNVCEETNVVGCMEVEWQRGMGIARAEIAYLWSAWEKMFLKRG